MIRVPILIYYILTFSNIYLIILSVYLSVHLSNDSIQFVNSNIGFRNILSAHDATGRCIDPHGPKAVVCAILSVG